MTAIGSDDEIGANCALALRGGDADADYDAVFLDEVSGFCFRFKMETWVAAALLGQKIQEVPLGHEGEEFAVGGEMGEIGDGETFAPDLGAKLLYFLVRAL